ncbi:MAG: hypothetical protein ABI379_12245 [Rhodanobacter sp.]
MNSTHPFTLAAIAQGGLLAGTIDMGTAALIKHISPAYDLARDRQRSAGRSGILWRHGGRVAWTGVAMGNVTADCGNLRACGTPDLPGCTRRAVAGVMYGVVVFVVMDFVGVPLSAAHARQHGTDTALSENLLALMLFGLVVVFCARGARQAGDRTRGAGLQVGGRAGMFAEPGPE